MTEDEIIIVLARIEALAGRNADLTAHVKRLQRADDLFRTVQQERDRLRKDLKAAEDKVEEWFNYSQAWAPLIPTRRHKELKARVPKPLDTDIPF